MTQQLDDAPVARQHAAIQLRDALTRGVVEQHLRGPRADTAALPGVGDDNGELRDLPRSVRVRRIAGVTRDSDELLLPEPGDDGDECHHLLVVDLHQSTQLLRERRATRVHHGVVQRLIGQRSHEALLARLVVEATRTHGVRAGRRARSR
jgi:hypothetical protein